MSEPIPLAELLGPLTRRCTRCQGEKPLAAEHWPQTKGKPVGALCRECTVVVKAESAARRKAAARNATANTSLAAQALKVGDCLSEKELAHNQAIMQARAELAGAPPGKAVTSKLETALALKQGANFLNQNAQAALTRLAEWMEDPEHPHHLWAVQFVAERALPRKLYESLGAEAAGVGGQVKERPTFIVNVLPAGAKPVADVVASAPRIEGRVIDVTPIEERKNESGME